MLENKNRARDVTDGQRVEFETKAPFGFFIFPFLCIFLAAINAAWEGKTMEEFLIFERVQLKLFVIFTENFAFGSTQYDPINCEFLLVIMTCQKNLKKYLGT